MDNLPETALAMPDRPTDRDERVRKLREKLALEEKKLERMKGELDDFREFAHTARHLSFSARDAVIDHYQAEIRCQETAVKEVLWQMDEEGEVVVWTT